MFINDLSKALEIGYKTMRPLCIMGAPGVGKSDTVRQFGETLANRFDEEVGIIEVRGASLNPGELADISYVSDGVVKSAPQDWLPTNEKVKAGECAPRGIIFMDEFADSMMSIQSSLQRLTLDRRLGSLTLADGWYTVLATNRQKDKAAAGRLSTALVNRCIVITLEADSESFNVWGINNGIDYRVLAFNRFRPDSINSFDPTVRAENPAFTSPRSLEIASDILKGADVSTADIIGEMLMGTLGDGVGSELNGFLQVINQLPDIDKILAQPDTYPVPTATNVVYATIGAISNRLTEDNYAAIMKFFKRLTTELSVVAIKDLALKEPKIFGTPEFVEWSSNNIKFAV